jgi:hypothetical protein
MNIIWGGNTCQNQITKQVSMTAWWQRIAHATAGEAGQMVTSLEVHRVALAGRRMRKGGDTPESGHKHALVAISGSITAF